MESANTKPVRTAQQNKALWLFFEMLAEALNDAGLDQRTVLKPGIDIPWNKDSVHDQLWIPIQKALTGTDSTTELSTVDPSDVYEVLNRHLASKLGVHVDFPSIRG